MFFQVFLNHYFSANLITIICFFINVSYTINWICEQWTLLAYNYERDHVPCGCNVGKTELMKTTYMIHFSLRSSCKYYENVSASNKLLRSH